MMSMGDDDYGDDDEEEEDEDVDDDGFHLQDVDEVVGFAWVSWQLKVDKFKQFIFLALILPICGLAKQLASV